LPELDRALLRGLSSAQRREIGAAWRRDGLTEHASIASFVRARSELARLGAPRELLRDCRAAARDEVRHARLCLALAAAYDGERLVPGALPRLPLRAPDLARLAVDTFVEGCVGETVAALCARVAAAECREPVVAAVLAEITADESRHAALAWRTVKWALAVGGAPVRRAVLDEARRLSVLGRVADIGDPSEGRGHGRLGPARLEALRRQAWEALIGPLLVELVGAGEATHEKVSPSRC
ncbi:MAG: hypothetical protein KC431_28775, partial [Myxococcales bacterium]|nr:hypothetical protein [Myxococcales bacterium]